MRLIFGNIVYFLCLPILLLVGSILFPRDMGFILRHIRLGLTGKDYR